MRLLDVSKRRAPGWVPAILAAPATFFIARLLMVSAYLEGGIAKALDFHSAVAEQVHAGVHPPALWAVVTIALELVAPALILVGRGVWLAAGALGAFTGLAALLVNDFWAMPHGVARFQATNAFFEHLGLIGGFILIAMLADQRAKARSAATP